jgi:hypothetical protein
LWHWRLTGATGTAGIGIIRGWAGFELFSEMVSKSICSRYRCHISLNLTDLTMAQKPKPPKTKKGTPPPIDKLVKPAIGVALALLGYYFFQGINSEVCILYALKNGALIIRALLDGP